MRYQSGKRSSTENYRGIDRLSDIPKLFEKLFCDQVYPEEKPENNVK